MKLVVVFDTSVLFSAVGWSGKPSQCLQLARDGRIEGVTGTEILDELSEKLAAKLAFSDQQIIEVVGSLQIFLKPVAITCQMTNLCADPKDDMVLECALVAGATQVVSSDKKHLLSLKQFRGIGMVSPAELIVMVETAALP
jgi:putative PIN family toxin of toxin-antitoxin system